MSTFGSFMTIDDLAGGDVLKYEAILEQPYIVILRKRQLNHAVNEYRKRYTEIMQNKFKKGNP